MPSTVLLRERFMAHLLPLNMVLRRQAVAELFKAKVMNITLALALALQVALQHRL